MLPLPGPTPATYSSGGVPKEPAPKTFRRRFELGERTAPHRDINQKPSCHSEQGGESKVSAPKAPALGSSGVRLAADFLGMTDCLMRQGCTPRNEDGGGFRPFASQSEQEKSS